MDIAMRNKVELEMRINRFANTLRIMGGGLTILGLGALSANRFGTEGPLTIYSTVLLAIGVAGATMYGAGSRAWRILLAHGETCTPQTNHDA